MTAGALENTDASATRHLLMHRSPDELTAQRLENMAISGMRGKGNDTQRTATASRFWEVGTLGGGDAGQVRHRTMFLKNCFCGF